VIRDELIQRKLGLIGDDLYRLLRFKDETRESLTADDIKLAAVERLIERVVMRAIDINEHLLSELAGPEQKSVRISYRETFLGLAELGVYSRQFAQRIAASAGLRNILLHDYNDVDRRILHGSIRTCLQDYQQYIDAVDEFIQKHQPQR
jgi:uncharacterized protein YutE (UPF0331/DUF86 family)